MFRYGARIVSAALFSASIFMVWGKVHSGPLEIRFAEPGYEICVATSLQTCQDIDWKHQRSAHAAFESILYSVVSGDAAERFQSTQSLRTAAGKWTVPTEFPRIDIVFPIVSVATLAGQRLFAIAPALIMATATMYMTVVVTQSSTSIGYGLVTAMVATALNLLGSLF
jgi:hypothetical protein